METLTGTVGHTYAPESTMTWGSGPLTGGSEAYSITGDTSLPAAPRISYLLNSIRVHK